MLEEAWAAACAGARQCVFIGGEAGGGKSRLAAECAAAGHRAGSTVLIGACVADLGQPYQPFVEPFSAVLQAIAAGDLPADDSPTDGRSLVEWLRVLTGSDEAGDDRHAFQRQLCAAAARVIRTVERHGPVLLVLEDLHWSGPAGQQLLTQLVHHTSACRLLIVATHRDAAPDRSPAFVETIATLQGAAGVQRLDLPPLRSEDIAEYLIREAGIPAEPAEYAGAVLREQTGGNPYFLGELWRDLSARGGLRALRDPVATPVSVRDAFETRTRRLDLASVRIIQLAAVIGEEIEPAVLSAAADCMVEEVLTAVDHCVDAGLLTAVADGDDRFHFAHALARQAVLEATPTATRMRHHARVAEVIKRLPATRDRVQRLAHHYASAHVLGYTDEAVHYLVRSAQSAAQGLAHQEAARLYERAAALTTRPAERDGTLLQAMHEHTHAGEFARARELAERVAATGSDPHRLSATVAFEAACWRPGLPGHRAAHLLTTALQGAGPEITDAHRARALAGLGRALAFTGARERASAALAEAIELARGVGDDALVMEALSASLWERRAPRYAVTVRERAEELSELARRAGDLVALGPAAHSRTMTAYLLGEPDALDASYRELVDVAHSTGQAYFEYFAAGVAYMGQFVAGDFAAAGRTCTAQLQLGLSFIADEPSGPFGVQMFMVRRESGELDRVRPLITGNEEPGDHWAPGLLALYTEFGLRDPAIRVMRSVLDDEALCDETSAQWPMVLVFLAEAALMLQDRAAAALLRPALERYTGLNLVAQPFVAVFGSADRYIGAIDSLLEQGDPEASLATALDMDTRMSAPVHIAQTLAATAAHRRRRGSGDAGAREPARRARAIAEPLALRRVLRMVDGPAGASRPAGLTDREVEVLRLIGAGLGNREIGTRLFITENTAANHVRSILAKTCASNRTQAAQFAAEHGLL